MSEKSEKEIEMKKEVINEENSHHEKDEAKLSRLEANLENGESENAEPKTSVSKPKKMFAWILTAAIIVLVGIIGFACDSDQKISDERES